MTTSAIMRREAADDRLLVAGTIACLAAGAALLQRLAGRARFQSGELVVKIEHCGRQLQQQASAFGRGHAAPVTVERVAE